MHELPGPEAPSHSVPCLRLLPGEKGSRPGKKDRKEAKESQSKDRGQLDLFATYNLNLWQTGTSPDQ
jgi:hypothetical protein